MIESTWQGTASIWEGLGPARPTLGYPIVLYTHLLLESMITPVALSRPPTVTAGASDNGTFNLKSNSSCPSSRSSVFTGTLTLLVVTPPANVAVSVLVMKSTPPVNEIIFNQHNYYDD